MSSDGCASCRPEVPFTRISAEEWLSRLGVRHRETESRRNASLARPLPAEVPIGRHLARESTCLELHPLQCRTTDKPRVFASVQMRRRSGAGHMRPHAAYAPVKRRVAAADLPGLCAARHAGPPGAAERQMLRSCSRPASHLRLGTPSGRAPPCSQPPGMETPNPNSDSPPPCSRDADWLSAPVVGGRSGIFAADRHANAARGTNGERERLPHSMMWGLQTCGPPRCADFRCASKSSSLVTAPSRRDSQRSPPRAPTSEGAADHSAGGSDGGGRAVACGRASSDGSGGGVHKAGWRASFPQHVGQTWGVPAGDVPFTVGRRGPRNGPEASQGGA